MGASYAVTLGRHSAIGCIGAAANAHNACIEGMQARWLVHRATVARSRAYGFRAARYHRLRAGGSYRRTSRWSQIIRAHDGLGAFGQRDTLVATFDGAATSFAPTLCRCREDLSFVRCVTI
jgi:hypothetical protein